MLKLQAVVSASTIALREIEAEQAEAQEAAITLSPSCLAATELLTCSILLW